MTRKRYRVLTAINIEHLEEVVNNALERGAQLVAGPVFVENKNLPAWNQAVIIPEKD